MTDATEFPTVVLSPGEQSAVELEGRLLARQVRSASFPPFVPAAGEEEWWAKVVAVADYGGR